jgi:preprotein translocase subunit SecA
MVEKLGLPDNEPLTADMLTKQIESAQKKIEGRNFETRRHVLEYDDVMNRQREVIYGQRRRVVMGENVKGNILGMEDRLIESAVGRDCQSDDSREWDMTDLKNYLENLCLHPGFMASHQYLIDNEDKDAFIAGMQEDAHAFYEEREKEITELGVDMREFERVMLLRAVDRRWMDHIDAMDELRDGIGYRAYSGKNPITEYQIEAGHMFEELNFLIREDTVRAICHARIQRTPEPVQQARPTLEMVKARLQLQQSMQKPTAQPPKEAPRQPVHADRKIGRNDPCPCGSGKKYKNCCGKNLTQQE